MQRLSDYYMLDNRMRAGRLEEPDIEAISSLLSRFFESLPPERIDADHQLAYLAEHLNIDAAVLCRKEFGLTAQVSPLLNKTHRLLFGWLTAKERCDPCHQEIGDPRMSGYAAFHAKLCNFFVGIDNPHHAVEFQAINDLKRSSQPNVFRPEIAVPLAKPA